MKNIAKAHSIVVRKMSVHTFMFLLKISNYFVYGHYALFGFCEDLWDDKFVHCFHNGQSDRNLVLLVNGHQE